MNPQPLTVRQVIERLSKLPQDDFLWFEHEGGVEQVFDVRMKRWLGTDEVFLSTRAPRPGEIEK